MMFIVAIVAAASALEECDGNSVSLLTLKTEMKQHARSRDAVAAWSTRDHLTSMTKTVESHQRLQHDWAMQNKAAKTALKSMAMTVSSGGTVKEECASLCEFIPEGSRCSVPDCTGCDMCKTGGAAETTAAPAGTTAAPAATTAPAAVTTAAAVAASEDDAEESDEPETTAEPHEVLGAGHADNWAEGLHDQANSENSNTSHADWIEHLRNAPKHEHLSDRDTDINAFVQQQKQSADACSARTLEAKRTLDGIASKVLLLSDEIEAQEAIHEGGSSTIKEMLDKGRKSKEILEEDKQHCNVEYDTCWEGLDTHRLEIVELHQMANPELRSVISHGGLDHKVDYAAASKKYALEVVNHYLKLYKTADLTHLEDAYKANASALLQTKSCADIAEATKKVTTLYQSVVKAKTPSLERALRENFDGLDCDTQRLRLQDVYSEAFIAILEILNKEEKICEEAKALCAGIAYDKDDNKQASYQQIIGDGTKNIQNAKDVIATILPLLDNAKKEFDILTAHIKDLETNCEIDHDVTEHLERIRNMIKTLEKCPGRNDFTLVLPDVSDIEG
jgi:hypothetical protein